MLHHFETKHCDGVGKKSDNEQPNKGSVTAKKKHPKARLTKLLHQLLVLVQLLQRLSVHARNSKGLCLIAMLLVTEDTDAKLWARDALQPWYIKT